MGGGRLHVIARGSVVPKKPERAKKSKPRSSTAKKSSPKGSGPAPAKAAPEAQSVPVVATVRSVDSLGEIHQLAEKLASEGMKVTKVSPDSGQIYGSYQTHKIAALNSKVPKVVVEPEVSAVPT